MSDPAPELKTYHGSCQCSAFEFTVKLPELTLVYECNCSICFRKGYKWVFPGPGCLTIDKGEGTLKDYEFAKCTMAHKFCPTCGTGISGLRHEAPPGQNLGLNVRTLTDVDISSLKVGGFDGNALPPHYIPTEFTGPEPSATIQDGKMYTGGCHCGATTLALKTRGPLSEGHEKIQECDCSVCTRNGTILLQTPTPNLSITTTSSASPLTSYPFGGGDKAHQSQHHLAAQFCSKCGVYVYLQKLPVPKDVTDSWSREDKDTWETCIPVNLRCLDGLGVDLEALQVQKGYWAPMGVKE